MRKALLILSVIGFALISCALSEGAGSLESEQGTPIQQALTPTLAEEQEPVSTGLPANPTEYPVEIGGSGDGGDCPSHFVALGTEDLARRLGISPEAISLMSCKPVTWPDGTLGCPKPGMDFTPVEIPGFVLSFVVEGKILRYHTDGSERILYCPAEGDRPDEIFIMP